MIDTKMVVVYPRGQLSARDMKRLSAHGIIAVEADDPAKVVTVLPIAPSVSPVHADDMTMALLYALAKSNYSEGSVNFVSELYRRAKAGEQAPTTAPTP